MMRSAVLCLVVSVLLCVRVDAAPGGLDQTASRQICPGNTATCEAESTCCSTIYDDTPACCPLKNAVCCADGAHCCPVGTTCNIDRATCDVMIPDNNSNTTIPALRKQPSTTTPSPDLSSELSSYGVGITRCADRIHECPKSAACCRKSASSRFGCCNYPTNVCCDDGKHCCPTGTVCEQSTLQCKRYPSTVQSLPWTELTASSSTEPAAATAVEPVDVLSDSRSVQEPDDVQCPDEVIDNAPAVCGVPAIEPIPPAENIVGGIEAKPNSWPWMCSLTSNDDDSWSHGCGCSVLNNKTLLTAAHCLSRGAVYRVRCGIHYRTGSNPHEQTVRVSIYERQELYNPQTYDYDVAVLKLATALTFNNFVSPVCLPPNDVPPGTRAIATGWGSTSPLVVTEGGLSNELRQVTVPIMSQKLCIKDYGTGKITDRMLCAGYQEGGKDACQGDSGGPLVIKRKGVWEIQGITSWGNGCAQKGYPGVYTRVTKMLSWIKQRL